MRALHGRGAAYTPSDVAYDGAMTPFALAFDQDNRTSVTTSITATADPVPAGSMFVIEHISGWFAVGESDIPDAIWAYDSAGNQQVFLPTQFASRPLNFGDALGVARMHQFGSPVRMYIDPGANLAVRADANTAGVLFVAAVGHLDPA
jgi:hypothetical protein